MLFFALFLIFEEWGWVPLSALMGRLARLPLWAKLERKIARLPPWAALVVLGLPTLALLPIKLLALYLLGQGQAARTGSQRGRCGAGMRPDWRATSRRSFRPRGRAARPATRRLRGRSIPRPRPPRPSSSASGPIGRAARARPTSRPRQTSSVGPSLPNSSTSPRTTGSSSRPAAACFRTSCSRPRCDLVVDRGPRVDTRAARLLRCLATR